jgi:hypothetical protein
MGIKKSHKKLDMWKLAMGLCKKDRFAYRSLLTVDRSQPLTS